MCEHSQPLAVVWEGLADIRHKVKAERLQGGALLHNRHGHLC